MAVPGFSPIFYMNSKAHVLWLCCSYVIIIIIIMIVKLYSEYY